MTTYLQIQMNYVLLVHMIDTLDKLLDVEHCLDLCDAVLWNNPLKEFSATHTGMIRLDH